MQGMTVWTGFRSKAHLCKAWHLYDWGKIEQIWILHLGRFIPVDKTLHALSSVWPCVYRSVFFALNVPWSPVCSARKGF